MVCAPAKQAPGGWRLAAAGQTRTVSVATGSVAASLSAAWPSGGGGQRPIEGDGIATQCHRTVTVASKSGHAQPEVSGGAGRSVLPADLCSDPPLAWSVHRRSDASAYGPSDPHVYRQQKEVS